MHFVTCASYSPDKPAVSTRMHAEIWMTGNILLVNDFEANLGNPSGYTRFQFDFEFKF